MKNQSHYILGLNISHNASAALLKDSRLIASVSEERFTRRKNQIGFPAKSIKFLLKFAHIKPKDLNQVVVATKNPHAVSKLLTRGRLTLEQEKKFIRNKKYENIFLLPFLKYLRHEIYEILYYKYPNLVQKIISLLTRNSDTKKGDVYNIFSKLLNIPRSRIYFLDHHLAHAYSCISNLDLNNKDWLIITIDGEGDDACCTINTYKNGVFERIAKTNNKHSLGLLYGYTTHFLGMRRDEHEYKVMGLAPYAKKKDYQDLVSKFEKYLKVDTDDLTLHSEIDMHNILPFLRRDFCSERFDNIAGALQEFTENTIVKLVSAAIKKTGIPNVAMAGGVIMNVKANQKVAELDEVKDCYFVPSAADESLAWGAAFWGYNQTSAISHLEPVKDLYLGPSYNSAQIIKSFKKFNKNKDLNIKKPKNITFDVAKLISQGQVVAWYQGRMEWGARALGNRSILGHPGQYQTLNLINTQIKNRDFWMPFTPSILEENMKEFIINPKNITPDYMIVTFNTSYAAQTKLISAIHPADKTVRPQMVRKEWNPKYYQLISDFKKISGIGALLNTSFNLHGEPIVCSPDDACHTLLNSGLKFLAIGDFLVSKRD